MADELRTDPSSGSEPPSNGRLLLIMSGVGVLGATAAAIFASPSDGAAFFVGSVLAFVNYLWMKRSLRRIFDASGEAGTRPGFLGAGYFIRYLVLAAVVAVVYASGVLPIVPFMFGLASFGFATVIEGFVRIATGFSNTSN